MPADAVDPGIDEEWEHEAVQGTAQEHAGQECDDKLDAAHRAEGRLTARTYPVGGTGSRSGSHQRAVISPRVDGAAGGA